MYVSIYLCTYVSVSMYLYDCTCICVSVYYVSVSMHVTMHVSMHVFIHVYPCICVSMLLCMCLCMYLCMYEWMDACMYVFFVCALRAHKSAYSCMYVRISVNRSVRWWVGVDVSMCGSL